MFFFLLNYSKISDQILRRTRSCWRNGYRHFGFWTGVVPNDTLKAATLPKVYLALCCLETHKEKVPALSVASTSLPSQHCCLSNTRHLVCFDSAHLHWLLCWMRTSHLPCRWAMDCWGKWRRREEQGLHEILLRCLVPGAGPTSTHSAMVVSLKICSVLKICSLVPLALSLPWSPQSLSNTPCLSPLRWLLWQRLLLVWKCKSAPFTKALVAKVLWD